MRTAKAWSLQAPLCEFRIFRWRPLTDEERPRHYIPRAFVISEWLESLHTQADVFDMYEAAFGLRLASAAERLSRAEIARDLEDAFRRRVLVCLRIEHVVYAGPGPTGSRPPPAPPPEAPPTAPVGPAQNRTWIEIELVDHHGKPIPAERYTILLPDGSRADDRLNASGRAFFDNIDPGSCELSFPDIDGREWEPA